MNNVEKINIISDTISILEAHMFPVLNRVAGKSYHNELNAVFVEGDFVGPVLLYGKGAGEKPTASAVVSDVVRVKGHENVTKNNDLKLRR